MLPGVIWMAWPIIVDWSSVFFAGESVFDTCCRSVLDRIASQYAMLSVAERRFRRVWKIFGVYDVRSMWTLFAHSRLNRFSRS